MAKRKTPKVDKVIDLKPEKVSEEQLKEIQDTVNTINRTQLELGSGEVRKHTMLHNIGTLQEKLRSIQSDLEKDYGTFDINIQDGTINYPENGETDKKD